MELTSQKQKKTLPNSQINDLTDYVPPTSHFKTIDFFASPLVEKSSTWRLH